MLAVMVITALLSLGTTKATAQYPYQGGPANYIPPPPGPGYSWVNGYMDDGYWVPGRWVYVGGDDQGAYGYGQPYAPAYAPPYGGYQGGDGDGDGDQGGGFWQGAAGVLGGVIGGVVGGWGGGWGGDDGGDDDGGWRGGWGGDDGGDDD